MQPHRERDDDVRETALLLTYHFNRKKIGEYFPELQIKCKSLMCSHVSVYFEADKA